MAHGKSLGTDDLGQKCFRSRVAMQNVVFAAFLVIEHELHGNACGIRPLWMRRSATVADEIAWIGSAFGHVICSRCCVNTDLKSIEPSLESSKCRSANT